MKSVPSFINEYESNLYLSITKKNKHHLLMYCSLYRRGLTLTLESFLLCIKIPIKKCPATITEALNAAYTLVRGGGGFDPYEWLESNFLYNVTPKSHIKVTRIKETITN